MPAQHGTRNHAALAELIINSSQQVTFTEHYIRDFSEFLCALTSISTTTLNPLNVWDKLVTQPEGAGSLTPVQQYIESLDSQDSRRIYRPIKKSSKPEKKARVELSKASAKDYPELLTLYLNKFYTSEFNTPPALCIYLDQHAALESEKIIELLSQAETQELIASIQKASSLVNSTNQFLLKITEQADVTSLELISAIIDEVNVAIESTDIFMINEKAEMLYNAINLLAQKLNTDFTFTVESAPIDDIQETSLPQTQQLKTLFQLDNRLRHRQFAQLPLNQLLQIAHPLLNSFNREDILAILAYNNIRCLQDKRQEIIERPTYSFEAFMSASLTAALDEHQLKIQFIQAFVAEAQASPNKTRTKSTCISEKLAAEILLIDTPEERQKSDLFLLLSSPLRTTINACSTQSERSELQDDITEEINLLLDPLQVKFNVLYRDWSSTLQKEIKSTKTAWHHALNTLYFLNMYIAASTRYMTPEMILGTFSPPSPLHSRKDELQPAIFHANKLVSELECSPCPLSVYNLSLAFFPGSTSIESNPEYWSIARKAKELAIATALETMYLMCPKFEQDPRISPTELQLGFTNLLVDYFVPNSKERKSTEIVKDWIKELYLPNAPLATELFSRGTDLLSRKKSISLTSFTRKLNKKRGDLTAFEHNQLLLYLLFYPNFQTVIALSHAGDSAHTDLFLQELSASSLVLDAPQQHPSYQTFNIFFPPCLEDKVQSMIAKFFHSFDSQRPCFFSKNACNPTYLEIPKIMQAFELFTYSTLENLALYQLYTTQQKPTTQRTFTHSDTFLQSALSKLWKLGGSIQDIFSCHRTSDWYLYKDGYQDKLDSWTSALINTLPYMIPGDYPARGSSPKPFSLPSALDSKELRNFSQESSMPLPQEINMTPIRNAPKKSTFSKSRMQLFFG